MCKISSRCHLISMVLLFVVMMVVARQKINVRLLVDLTAVAEVRTVAPFAVIRIKFSTFTTNSFQGMPVTRFVQILSTLFRNSSGCFQLGSGLQNILY